HNLFRFAPFGHTCSKIKNVFAHAPVTTRVSFRKPMNAQTPAHNVRSRCLRGAFRPVAAGVLFIALTGLAAAQQPAPAGAENTAAAKEDALKLNAFVVTGSVAPRTKLESPVAITTIDRARIEDLNPRNFAEAVKA